MWQRFLDRFVPLLDDAPSRLDLLDGVGSRCTGDVAQAARSGPSDAGAALPASH